MGQPALAGGNKPVYVSSKPYQAWSIHRGGQDGIPWFIDVVVENGKRREIVWWLETDRQSSWPDHRGGEVDEPVKWRVSQPWCREAAIEACPGAMPRAAWRCRTGTVKHVKGWNGPGSAERHDASHRVRGTRSSPRGVLNVDLS
jgi:hypothetical protein